MVKKATGVKSGSNPHEHLTRSVIRVGDGRGFVAMISGGEQVVITAGHCLPFFPPCHAASYLEHRTYRALLGPLNDKPTVWAECLFVDPIADIAVLGPPDNQELADKAHSYQQFVVRATPIPIADAPKERGQIPPAVWHSDGRTRRADAKKIKRKMAGKGSGLVLSLDGHWVECWVTRYKECLSIEPAKLVAAGMSGSPVLSVKGQAIGVVSIGGSGSDQNAVLVDNLPTKFLPQRRS
jgi:hypothetical protein